MRLGPVTRACALAFLTAFVTLFTQILVHRMVSLKLANNLAFLVISLTMLGFACSGAVLSRGQRGFLAKRDDVILLSGALFALTFIGVTIAFYRAPAGAQWAPSRGEFLSYFLRLMPLALLYAIPFSFCGLILGILLSSAELPVRRVYAYDLLGSALGAVSVIAAISGLGVERSGLLACAVMVVGAWSLSRPSHWFPRGLAALSLLVIVWSAIASDRVFAMAYPVGSVLEQDKDPTGGFALEYAAWDPLARIELSRIPVPSPDTVPWPYLVGGDPLFLARFTHILTQNNTAFTYAVEYSGKPSLSGIEQTLYAAAYETTSVPHPRVLVIGVGGGFDVLTALHADAAEVTGIEVNGATVDILTRKYRDYFRSWTEDPRVRLIHAEGRNFLANTRQRFDVIQLSGVDSVSGTPAMAHVFSENYLYTTEAFDLYLARLSDDGIMNMMRTEYRPPREMLRALVTAVGALRRVGVDRPADHIAMVTSGDGLFSSLLVKRTPLTPVELEGLESWASRSPFFGLSAAPRLNEQRLNPYQTFLSMGDGRREAAFISRYPFDVRPVDDDRPFFFRYSFWSHLFPRDAVVAASVPVMEYGLLLLLGLTGLVAVGCVYLPLRPLWGGGLPTPGAGRYGVFFGGLGLGYMAIEIALLQKFGLFLGHPNYALSVVLAVLLLSTGLGALASEWLVARVGELRYLSYVLAGLLLMGHALVLARPAGGVGLPFWVRVTIVCGVVTPIGFCLGLFFPTGLERLKRANAASVPWAWGLSGIFSVISPVISVAVSVTWGFSALLLASIPVYLVASFALPSETVKEGA
jgi:spermidine synthase